MKKNFFFYLILFIPIFYIITFNLLNGYLFHDTLDYYRFFKYIFISSEQNTFPLWTPKLDNGLSLAYMYFWSGSLGLTFLKIGQLINLNSYYTFQLYITFLLIIFLYGIFLNLKNRENSILKFILFCSFYFGATVLYRQLAWDLLIYVCIPYIIYWSEKYSRTGNFKNINKITLSLLANYLVHSAYMLIYTGYISLIIILVYFFYYNRSIYDIKNKFKNLNIIYIIYFFIFLLSGYYLKNFQQSIVLENYAIVSPLRDLDGKVPYEIFSTYANYSILNLGNRTLNLNISDFDFQFYLNPIFLGLILIFFLKKKLLLSKELNIYVIIGILIFIIFFLNFDLKDRLLYSLPLFEYTRHLNFALIIAKPCLYLFLSILLVDNLNFTKDGNFFKKIENFKFGYLSKKIIFFTLCFCFCLENFYQVYSLRTERDDYTYKNFYKKDSKQNITYKYKCSLDHEVKYKKLLSFPKNTRWNHMPISVNLITEDVPCSSERRQEYLNKYEKKISENYNFIKYKLDNNLLYLDFDDLTINKEYFTNISYSPYWKAYENRDIKLFNSNGYLSILIINKTEKKIQLIYEDKKLHNYIFFQFITGIILIILFLFNFIKLFFKTNLIKNI